MEGRGEDMEGRRVEDTEGVGEEIERRGEDMEGRRVEDTEGGGVGEEMEGRWRAT